MNDVTVADIVDYRAIERYLRHDAAAQIYPLADLDEPFRSRASWHAAYRAGEIAALAIWVQFLDPPVLYGACNGDIRAMRGLLAAIAGRLPSRFFANLDVDAGDALADRYRATWSARYRRMALGDPARVHAIDTAGTVALGSGNFDELSLFLARVHDADDADAGFLEPYMLETGHYCGVRIGCDLVAAGGVHVFSPAYRVAALGNIATLPAFRRRGYARMVTARIVQGLCGRADHVGLNVRTDNVAAIGCYESLGFAPVREYVEAMYERAE